MKKLVNYKRLIARAQKLPLPIIHDIFFFFTSVKQMRSRFWIALGLQELRFKIAAKNHANSEIRANIRTRHGRDCNLLDGLG